MADRGEYRSIHVALADDADFLELSPPARLCLLMLKLTLGPSGINVVRALIPELMVTTGHGEAEVRAGLDALVRHRWIAIEGNVVWLRNGLRFEPNMSLQSENTAKGVCRHLRSLPRLPIVNAFAAYYGLPLPFPEIEQAPPEPHSQPLGSPFEPPTEAGRRDEGEGIRDIASHQLSAAGERPNGDDIDPGATPGSPAAAATPPPPPAATPDDIEAAISRVIVAANNAMTRNPAIDQARLRPIPTTGAGRQEVLDWIREGIPVEVILRQVETVALRYRPDATNRQISTMSYFGPAVRDAAALTTAREAGRNGDGDHGRSAAAKGRAKAAGAGAGRRRGSDRRRKFEHE